MREPVLERGQTWESFYRERNRRIDEIQCAMPSARPWELDQYKVELSQLYFERDIAERELMRSELPDDEVMPWE